MPNEFPLYMNTALARVLPEAPKGPLITKTCPVKRHSTLAIASTSKHVSRPPQRRDSLPQRSDTKWINAADSVVLKGQISASLEAPNVLIKFRVFIPPSSKESLTFFVHWGSYEKGAPPWMDEEVLECDIHELKNNEYLVVKEISPRFCGSLGATAFVYSRQAQRKIWLGQPYVDDARFEIRTGFFDLEDPTKRDSVIYALETEQALLRSLAHYKRFTRHVLLLSKQRRHRMLSRALFEITKESPTRRALISRYYSRAANELREATTPYRRGCLGIVLSVLKNIGVGEVALVAAEGPHAQAGGLAQAITGITKALSTCGVSVSLITPLYENAQGERHRNASEIIRDGILVSGQRVPLRYLGQAKVSIGAVYDKKSRNLEHSPVLVPLEVYLAERRNVRIFFLRHGKFFDGLYSNATSDEQLRRAIVLSRGVLEIVADRHFDLKPHILVSHDWHAGLVPILLRADGKYHLSQQLQSIECVHMLHNCGKDYQGRFPFQSANEDFWPLLGLAGEHRFGLVDPGNEHFINITAGAIFHAKKVVTVSRPYAEQLLTEEGGEGLHVLLQEKKNLVFGISNGIDLVELRKTVWGKSREKATSFSGHAGFSLEQFKSQTKLEVQADFGLEVNPDALLISFIGRIVEQKGISLLLQPPRGEQQPLLELLLARNQSIQFFLGGPVTSGDRNAEKLRSLARVLSETYPNRFHADFDFIEHAKTLRLTAASDLFLMPSRYEPGGISQLEALAVGTPAVARRVGGILATLVDFDEGTKNGNAFLFDEYSADALYAAINRAFSVLKDPSLKSSMIEQAASAMHDWSERAPKYLAFLQRVAGVFQHESIFPHLVESTAFLSEIQPH